MICVILLNSGVPFLPVQEYNGFVSYCQDAMDTESDKEENTSSEMDDKVQPGFSQMLIHLVTDASRVAFYSSLKYCHHPEQVSPPPEKLPV